MVSRARPTFDVAMHGGWRVRLQFDFGQGRALVQGGPSHRGAGRAMECIPTAHTRRSLAYELTVVPPGRTVREHALLLRVQQGF